MIVGGGDNDRMMDASTRKVDMLAFPRMFIYGRGNGTGVQNDAGFFFNTLGNSFS